MVKYINKEKFEGNKPLLKYSNDYYPDKFLIHYHGFDEPKEFDLWDAIKGEAIEPVGRIVFGVKAKEEELVKYDFLWCPDGPAFVVHQRVLDKFNEVCPKDIQALPIIIKNLDPNGEKFENKEFWLINILNIVEAFDKNFITISSLGIPKITKKVLLDGSMGSHLICRDFHCTSRVLFHPSLAKHFIKSKGIQFLTDEEAPK